MTQDRIDPVGTWFCRELVTTGWKYDRFIYPRPGEKWKNHWRLLKEIVPGLSRVAVFGTSTEPEQRANVKRGSNYVADALRIKLLFRDVLSLQDLEHTAFRAAVKERAGAVLMEVSGPITGPQRKEIAELAVKSRLPVMHGRREPVEAGGLMSVRSEC